MALPYGAAMNNLCRAAIALAVILASLPAFAQPADFAISIEGTREVSEPADRIGVGQIVYYLVQWTGAGEVDRTSIGVEVDVPGVVTHLYEGPAVSCTAADGPVRCTVSEHFEPGGYFHFGVRVAGPGVYTTTARLVHHGAPDAYAANDVATHTFEAVALPALQLTSGIFLQQIEPGASGTFSVYAQNRAATPATNATLTVKLPAGGTFVAAASPFPDQVCTTTSDFVTCTAPSLVQNQYLATEVTFIAPARMDGADLVIEMAVTLAEQDLEPEDNQLLGTITMVRQLVVDNVNDEGSGSLRQAIHDVNALCAVKKPCAILFRIPAPVPENGWFTIQPRTPLPLIRASLKIDGRTQTLFTGDTNPDGPEIEINGAFVHELPGIRVRPNCDVQIRNLAVNGFPGFGIEALRHDSDVCLGSNIEIVENYLGTDPRGRVAKPNGRGLGVFGSSSTIAGNLISGNRRSGIYVNGGFTEILQNRIGVAVDGSPLGNSAGIFLDVNGADVTENVIAHNDGMAIARTRRGEILIIKNSMFGNLQQGIDVDIDGPSAQRSDDTDVPNAPVLFSATFDPVRNVTIVRGRIDSNHVAHTNFIEVYASSALSRWGTPQAEQLAGAGQLLSAHMDFEIVVPGDLRGKWITATYNAVRFDGFVRPDPRGIVSQTHRQSHPGDTSELSNALPVQ